MQNSALLPQAFPVPTKGVCYPTDFSQDSFVAFDHALRIALNFKTALDITHAEPKNDQAPARWYPDPVATLKKWEVIPAGGTDVDAVATGLTWRRSVQVGKPAVDAIIDELEARPADLIVMTTYLREGISRVLYGTVAEPLARKAHLPLLIIPPHARRFVSELGELELNRILVPIAPEPSPQVALDYAAAFARGMGVKELELATLWAGDPAKVPYVYHPQQEGWTTRSWTGANSVVDEIVSTATSWKAQLIVMTSEGRQGMTDRMFGSTVEQVLHRSPCPVMILPVLPP